MKEEVKGGSNSNEDLTEFNPDRWVRVLSKLASAPTELDVDAFIGVLHETLNLFKKMGSALSMAFSGKATLLPLLTLVFFRHFNQG